MSNSGVASTAYEAAILAVGNEVTDGQIINSNASWLAERLVAQGFAVTLHLAVPDDVDRIRGALSFASVQASWIFICGGLGPTSDDLTRSAIAQWGERDLLLNEDALKRVEQRLHARGVSLREGHRLQCHFPAGAHLWPNHQGTADGFSIEVAGQGSAGTTTRIFAMPGPPRELESVWVNGLGESLATIVPPEHRWDLFTWNVEGLGESEVAHRVEAVVGSLQGLRLGFRLHRPFVEVKVWLRRDPGQSELWANLNTEFVRVLGAHLRPAPEST